MLSLLSLGCYTSRSKVYKPITPQLKDSSTSNNSGLFYQRFRRGDRTSDLRLLHSLLKSLQAHLGISLKTRQPQPKRAHSTGVFQGVPILLSPGCCTPRSKSRQPHSLRAYSTGILQGVPQLLTVGCYIPRSKACKLTNAPA